MSADPAVASTCPYLLIWANWGIRGGGLTRKADTSHLVQTEEETSSTLQRIPNGKETFCFLSKSFAWEDAASPGLDIRTVEDREHVPTTVLTNTCSSHNETPCHPKHFEFSACRFPLLSPTYSTQTLTLRVYPPNPTMTELELHSHRCGCHNLLLAGGSRSL